MHIIDTAGLRDAIDEVEARGIERSWAAIRLADLVIFLQDINSQNTTEDNLRAQILRTIPIKCPVLEVGNKSDLATSQKNSLNNSMLFISAKTGDGIDALKSKILETVGWGGTQEGVVLARRRHLDCLERAADHIRKSEEFVANSNISLELFAEELRLAQDQLGQITGKILPDDILGKIFSQFCVGK